MSLVLRQQWDKRVVLMSKGADTVMLKRAAAGQHGREAVEAHLVSV